MFRICTAIACVSMSFSTGITALAQTPKAVATHKDWSVFVREIEGERICFAATEAKDKSPKSVNHGDVFFMVASWKSGAATEQPSLMTGYTLKAKPEATLRIGSDKWEMYASENEGNAAFWQPIVRGISRADPDPAPNTRLSATP